MIPKYTDIMNLLKKGSTLEAQEKIMELREAVLELQEENSSLRRKLSELETQIRFGKSLQFSSPFYYAEGDQVPFCARCWEADKKAVHLLSPKTVPDGDRHDCPECKTWWICAKKGD